MKQNPLFSGFPLRLLKDLPRLLPLRVQLLIQHKLNLDINRSPPMSLRPGIPTNLKHRMELLDHPRSQVTHIHVREFVVQDAFRSHDGEVPEEGGGESCCGKVDNCPFGHVGVRVEG